MYFNLQCSGQTTVWSHIIGSLLSSESELYNCDNYLPGLGGVVLGGPVGVAAIVVVTILTFA